MIVDLALVQIVTLAIAVVAIATVKLLEWRRGYGQYPLWIPLITMFCGFCAACIGFIRII